MHRGFSSPLPVPWPGPISVYARVCVFACMGTCVGVYTCVHAYGGPNLTLSVLLNYFPLYLLRHTMACSILASLSSQLAPSSSSLSHFYMGSGDPQWGLNTCTVDILSTEPPPQSLLKLFFLHLLICLLTCAGIPVPRQDQRPTHGSWFLPFWGLNSSHPSWL